MLCVTFCMILDRTSLNIFPALSGSSPLILPRVSQEEMTLDHLALKSKFSLTEHFIGVLALKMQGWGWAQILHQAVSSVTQGCAFWNVHPALRIAARGLRAPLADRVMLLCFCRVVSILQFAVFEILLAVLWGLSFSHAEGAFWGCKERCEVCSVITALFSSPQMRVSHGQSPAGCQSNSREWQTVENFLFWGAQLVQRGSDCPVCCVIPSAPTCPTAAPPSDELLSKPCLFKEKI